jgi:hypothetical protein
MRAVVAFQSQSKQPHARKVHMKKTSMALTPGSAAICIIVIPSVLVIARHLWAWLTQFTYNNPNPVSAEPEPDQRRPHPNHPQGRYCCNCDAFTLTDDEKSRTWHTAPCCFCGPHVPEGGNVPAHTACQHKRNFNI